MYIIVHNGFSLKQVLIEPVYIHTCIYKQGTGSYILSITGAWYGL